MALIVREFFSRDPITGDPVFGDGKATTVTSTGSLKLDPRTKIIGLSTDSSTVTCAFGRDAVAADLAPAARGWFQMVVTSGLTLYYANAGS